MSERGGSPPAVASTSGLNLAAEAACYDSTFEDDLESVKGHRERRNDLFPAPGGSRKNKEPKASARIMSEEVSKDEYRRQRADLLSLSAYDRHKKLVNEYLLFFPGATKLIMQRDSSRDRRDIDVIKENHRFLWKEEAAGDERRLTWGEQLARRYWQKLYKEYCICDLSRYKENKVAMRWRTEKEVVDGKGQFYCGERKCGEREAQLRTWEVDFGYMEAGEKKNTLVKVRLCPDCSYRLNYRHRRKEVTKKKKEKAKKRRRDGDKDEDAELDRKVSKMRAEEEEKQMEAKAKEIWKAPVEVEQEKTREEDFSEYLEDLFM